ncbi:MAG: hypothetical protein J1F02_07925, partial [Lachnospiraceae bacterium]|nr:hypothetical protein [Lachnospiraceae bacterium]
MKKYKKNIVSILSLALILGLLPISVNKVSKASESEYGVSNPRISNEGVVTWDCIYFGSYWQNDTNGDGTADQNDEKEPIKWRVLSVDDNDAFLLADQNLDCQPYNEEDTDGTWETCTLRSWLNSIFYQNAFSVTEQNAITETTTVNAESGNDTNDKVYLLSNDEVMNPSYGFTSSFYYAETRKSKNTAYATECANMDGSSGPDSWWLLSPFFNSSTPPVEGKRSPFGVTNNNGYLVGVRRSDYNLAVRPVLHLNLSSSEWSKADTVSA